MFTHLMQKEIEGYDVIVIPSPTEKYGLFGGITLTGRNTVVTFLSSSVICKRIVIDYRTGD